jgi:hypothetical protein
MTQRQETTEVDADDPTETADSADDNDDDGEQPRGWVSRIAKTVLLLFVALAKLNQGGITTPHAQFGDGVVHNPPGQHVNAAGFPVVPEGSHLVDAAGRVAFIAGFPSMWNEYAGEREYVPLREVDQGTDGELVAALKPRSLSNLWGAFDRQIWQDFSVETRIGMRKLSQVMNVPGETNALNGRSQLLFTKAWIASEGSTHEEDVKTQLKLILTESDPLRGGKATNSADPLNIMETCQTTDSYKKLYERFGGGHFNNVATSMSYNHFTYESYAKDTPFFIEYMQVCDHFLGQGTFETTAQKEIGVSLLKLVRDAFPKDTTTLGAVVQRIQGMFPTGAIPTFHKDAATAFDTIVAFTKQATIAGGNPMKIQEKVFKDNQSLVTAWNSFANQPIHETYGWFSYVTLGAIRIFDRPAQFYTNRFAVLAENAIKSVNLQGQYYLTVHKAVNYDASFSRQPPVIAAHEGPTAKL